MRGKCLKKKNLILKTVIIMASKTLLAEQIFDTLKTDDDNETKVLKIMRIIELYKSDLENCNCSHSLLLTNTPKTVCDRKCIY